MNQLVNLPWFIATTRRVYVASSWRNPHQPGVVRELQEHGHLVYDFRRPLPGDNGFRWTDAAPGGADDIPSYLKAIQSPVAQRGFALDKTALDWCDTCVMVLPCGRSAHLEAGYAAGQGKHVVWWLHPTGFKPELMYLLGNDFVVEQDVVAEVERID